MDNDPSMLVYADGWFRCLGCSRHGHWKTLWNKLKGQTTRITREVATGWNGPHVHMSDLEQTCWQAHTDLLEFPSFQWYLEMRGVDPMIEDCELGYWQGWYSIPAYDRDGNFLAAVFRAAPHVQEASGMRYWAKGKPVMYVPNWQLLSKSYIFVVFGMFDAITLAMIGEPVVTVTSGKSSFRAEWLDEYRKPIYIIPDKGEYGSAMKLAAELDWRATVLDIDYPSGLKDPADFAKIHKTNELSILLHNKILERTHHASNSQQATYATTDRRTNLYP